MMRVNPSKPSQDEHNFRQMIGGEISTNSLAQSNIMLLASKSEPLPQSCNVPFFSLPVELVVYLLNWFDLPSQIALSETCRTTQMLFTQAQRKWWVFEKQYLAVLEQYNVECQSKIANSIKTLSRLVRCYQTVLNHLLAEELDKEERKILSLLAEKFFQHFAQAEIKNYINQVLASKPAQTNWQAIFEQLAEVNLHLCLTIMAMASPGFDLGNEIERKVIREKKIDYPFATLYPKLVSQLPFYPSSSATDALAKDGFRYADVVDNLSVNNVRIKQFFLQFRFRNHHYNTLLHFAVAYGYMEIITALVQDHRCVNLLDNNGQTILSLACFGGPTASQGRPAIDQVAVMQTLLDLGVNPNMQNNRGYSVLMFMSQSNNLEAIRLLLRYGAEANLQNATGDTALFKASHAETARLLLTHGAQVNHQDHHGMTALIYICKLSGLETYLDMAKVLLEYGAEVNIQDKRGRTALMYASERSDVALIQLLLDHQADPTLKDEQGNTALEYVRRKRHSDAEQVLLTHMPKAPAQLAITAEASLEEVSFPLIK
jgi:ankyrin repeat protein